MKDADLDAMLREMLDPENEYIPDDGFTGRVLGKLPSARPAPFFKYAILSIFAAVAAGFVFFITPGYTVVTDAVIESAIALVTFRLPPLASLAVVGIFLWGVFVSVRLTSRRLL